MQKRRETAQQPTAGPKNASPLAYSSQHFSILPRELGSDLRNVAVTGNVNIIAEKSR
jgi:hypothetical protein